MKKLQVQTREIGSIKVFDLVGLPTQETIEEAAWSIQRKIRRHRLQRVILNLQYMESLEPIGLRKLLAACIRPQKSIIFGANKPVMDVLESTYLPRNIRICASEKEVAEDFGPFLMEKEPQFVVPHPLGDLVKHEETIGNELDRRRSKRMHVALPIDIVLKDPVGVVISGKAIATNISEGGLFAEYLDLDIIHKLEGVEAFSEYSAELTIFPSTNFPEEYNLIARVVRKETRGKQLGLAFEFLEGK